MLVLELAHLLSYEPEANSAGSLARRRPSQVIFGFRTHSSAKSMSF